MTNEEAIAIIRNEYKCVDRDCDIERSCGNCSLMMPSKEPILEAYKMAIKALEQQPKTGHWIFQKIKYGEHLAPMRMWCSNCNSAFDLCCNQIKRYDEATKKEYLWGHCPWCGAKMVEPQESEEQTDAT